MNQVWTRRVPEFVKFIGLAVKTRWRTFPNFHNVK